MPFTIVFCGSHHLENCLDCVSPNNPQHLFRVSVAFAFARNLSVQFPEKKYWENPAVWDDLLFPYSSLFTSRPSCQSLEPRCSETAFDKQWLAFADFWDGETFFHLSFVWSQDSYLKPLLLFLLVVLCLISPASATYSVSLYKHVVSDVIKRCITFASLALYTLAPMFCIYYDFLSSSQIFIG